MQRLWLLQSFQTNPVGPLKGIQKLETVEKASRREKEHSIILSPVVAYPTLEGTLLCAEGGRKEWFPESSINY